MQLRDQSDTSKIVNGRKMQFSLKIMTLNFILHLFQMKFKQSLELTK